METLAAVPSGCFNLDWSPCSLSDDLKDRICPYTRMAPGLVTLISTIIAIICALVWESPYLCIAYIPACFASGYLMYLGWDFQNLQSFGESNVQLKSSISVLEKEVATYQKVNEQMEQKVNNLETIKKELDEVVEGLTTEKADLKATAEKLSGINTTLESSAALQVTHLATLKESIGGFQNATELSHSELAGHLTKFKQNIEDLADKSSAFETAGSAIEAQMQTHTKVLLEAAQSLTQIFTEINAWKDQAAIKERAESLQAMNKIATDLAKQSGVAETQLKVLQERAIEQTKIIQDQKEQIEKLGGEIMSLKRIKEGFDSTLGDLENVAVRLESTERALTPQTKTISARLKKQDEQDEND